MAQIPVHSRETTTQIRLRSPRDAQPDYVIEAIYLIAGLFANFEHTALAENAV